MIGTIAAWRVYATDRGDNALTAASDTLASAALVRASDYIQFTYISRFLSGFDATSPNVEQATYEAAAFELARPGFFTATFTPSQQKVLTEVKGIKWTPIEGTDSSDAFANATPTSTKIAAMLSRYMPGKFRIGLAAIGPINV